MLEENKKQMVVQKRDAISLQWFETDSTRRRIAVPNSYHFCKAVMEIVNYEAEILPKTKYSLWAPIAVKKPREQNPYNQL